MMKSCLLFILAASASAFAFVPQSSRSGHYLQMSTGDSTMSKSIPFLKKPKNLDSLTAVS